jgi:hypothetical protein
MTRPPEYFPTLPFWAEFLSEDEFAVSDGFQYSRQSLQNRTRLRTPDGWQWITIPVKGGQHGRAIREMEIDNSVPWMGKHLRALQYNYRTSPYFEAFEDRFKSFFDREWLMLGDVAIESIRLACELLQIDPPTVKEQAEGGEPISRTSFRSPVYRQNFDGFESGMSVLDTFFNQGFETERLIRQGIENDRRQVE